MSKREQVAQALKALVAAAVPNATVSRGPAKPGRIYPGGTVLIEDSDPGEPETTLSPLSYSYQHPFGLTVYGWPGSTPADLDALLTPIGSAIAAARTLSGLCEWLEASAPALDDADALGVEAVPSAQLQIVAHYTTASPI